MVEVEFNYNEKKTIIQCKLNDKIKNICQNYLNEINEDKSNIYFTYNENAGNNFNEELTFQEMMNSDDKKRNKMNILVFKNEIKQEENDIIKSKDIICPKCGESIRIEIINYKIKLSDCKNGHIIDNILLNKFEKTQYINNKEIKCGICNKNNKSKSENKIFYKCLKCKKNICPLCESNHDKTHKIINYDERLYICDKHYENYNSYCKECKINLCILCVGEHKLHKKIYFGDIMPSKEELFDYNKELKEYIVLFNNNINVLINMLKKVIENMNIYYKINEDIINKYYNKNRNYEILYNINKIRHNNIINELKNIVNESGIKSKFDDIFNVYCNMNINEINIIYKVFDNKTQLFGHDFVDKNKNNCKIIINGKEDELKEHKTFSLFSKKINKLEIKLKGIMNITDMSYMFDGCSSLSSLPDISKWNTNNVNNMSYMFYKCSSLSTLTDISKLNTKNVTNMSDMFGECTSLLSLPDISKWNTNNVTDMRRMFNGCSSLSSLPDISKWNTNNATNMNYMFYKCTSLSSLPDISKLNTNNIINMSGMFGECSSLLSLPDISKWNTNKVTDMSCMFYKCSSLSSLPDISKWNTNNVTNIKYMFDGCKESLKIPTKFKNK